MHIQTTVSIRQLPSYLRLHKNVYKARGKASEHACSHCLDPANQWATIHGRSGADVMDYMPLCYRCHKAYDGLADKIREFALTRPRNELGRWVCVS